MTPTNKIYEAMLAQWDRIHAQYMIDHVRASLTSSTGAFLVTGVSNIRVVGKNPWKRRVVTARVSLKRAPDFTKTETVNYRMVYENVKYNATLNA